MQVKLTAFADLLARSSFYSVTCSKFTSDLTAIFYRNNNWKWLKLQILLINFIQKKQSLFLQTCSRAIFCNKLFVVCSYWELWKGIPFCDVYLIFFGIIVIFFFQKEIKTHAPKSSSIVINQNWCLWNLTSRTVFYLKIRCFGCLAYWLVGCKNVQARSSGHYWLNFYFERVTSQDNCYVEPNFTAQVPPEYRKLIAKFHFDLCNSGSLNALVFFEIINVCHMILQAFNIKYILWIPQ